MLLIAVVLMYSQTASAATVVISSIAATPKVIITEVQMTGASAAQEFVELYNPTDEDIDLSDSLGGGKAPWRLHFFSASNVSAGEPVWSQPLTAISLKGTIPAHDYFLLASTDYHPGDFQADQYYSNRLTSNGGGLQLVQNDSTGAVIHDRLMWGSAADRPSGVWPAPKPGSSMQRLLGNEDEYISAGGLLTGFTNQKRITPYEHWEEELPAVPAPDESSVVVPIVPPVASPETPVITENTGLSPLIFTELLPNPASPEQDDTDEFIELFNPNDKAFNLKGYELEAGTGRVHSFIITDDVSIPAHGYAALYSADTDLPLSNGGSQVRLLDGNNQIISQAQPYTAAKEGQAWAASNEAWNWSVTPTPGQANVITAASTLSKPQAHRAEGSKKVVPRAATKVTGIKTTKVKSPKTAKVRAAKKVKASKARKQPQPKTAGVASVTVSEPKQTIHTGVLVAVAGLAVLYGAYEYRHDISDKFGRLRCNRAVGGRNGRAAQRRRGVGSFQ